MMEKQNKFTNIEGFGLIFVVDELNKTPNAAMQKIKTTGKDQLN